MDSYPVQLQLRGRLCVVVGGGRVGERKARGLLDAGARVRLVEPLDEAPACRLPGVERISRSFQAQDLAGALLVFAATDNAAVNEQVAALAGQEGILVNRADDPTGGDFALPALLKRGTLSFAVSSGGAHPAFSAAVRDLLAQRFGEGWATIADLAKALRRRELTPELADRYNSAVVRALMDERLPVWVEEKDWPAVTRHLHQFLGDCFSSTELGRLLPVDKT